MKQKLKSIVTLASLSCCLFSSAWVMAQPTHDPIAAYTNHKMGFTGYSLYVLPNLAGNFSSEPYDVAVTGNYHFQSGVSTFMDHGSFLDYMIICKKDAITGASVGMVRCDFGTLLDFPNDNSPVCKGMLLDGANNRIYVFGQINMRAVIACYDINSLTLVTSFGKEGAQQLSYTQSNVIDAVLMSNGNFAVLMNEKDVNNKNFMSIAGITKEGAWTGYTQCSNPAYECYGKRFRKHPSLSNTYYIAGKAVNTSALSIPMLWEMQASSSGGVVSFNPTKRTSNSFTSPAVGYGEFVDFGFISMQVIAIGNTGSQGIWAKYNIPVSGNLTPIATFKNGATLPGKGPAYTPFTRCLVDPAGYTIIASYNESTSMGDGRLGFITTSGNTYITMHEFSMVHKVSGLMKDNNGNVIAGGCDIHNGGITTVKFTSYAGAWGEVVNKQQAPLAVSEPAEETTFNTFPNPASNLLTITMDGSITDHASIQVFDISGKKVMEKNAINFSNQQTTIDLGDLKKGVYLVHLATNEESVMKKIVKQ